MWYHHFVPPTVQQRKAEKLDSKFGFKTTAYKRANGKRQSLNLVKERKGMKKTTIFVLCFMIAFTFVGCGKKQGVQLLENASPETSAMSFYYFDGENTTIKRLYDVAEEQKIIDDINQLVTKPVANSRVADMKVPCYGLEIVDKDGFEIWLTYSNGLWLGKDGAVYEADYDFRTLYDSVADTNPDTMEGGIHMLNSAILGQYDIRYYEKVEDMSNTRDGVTLSVTAVEGNIITVTIQNDSEDDFFYGEYYTLQKEIDGSWYRVPVRLSNYGFHDIGFVLQAHQSTEAKCDITMYGELDNGHYRIEKERLVADFIIEDAYERIDAKSGN